MKTILSILISLGFLPSALGMDKEAVVIQVRKKVKLHEMERVYADYFIKGGTQMGLDPGVIVSVVRRVPVHDPFDNASVGDFRVKVADVEIIQSDATKSIGRLVEIDRRQARPMLTYDAIMIGDRLDMESLRAKVSYREAPASVFPQDRQPAQSLMEPVPPMMDKGSETGKKEQSILTTPKP